MFTQVDTDSPVRTTLVSTESVVELGSATALSAFVFEGDTPVANANVNVVVRHEGGATSNAELLDDGLNADGIARDGVYSTLFVPESSGRYTVVGNVEGRTAAGVVFNRGIAAGFDVRSPKGRIVGIADDRAIDDDLDGVFDRVTVEVAVDILREGVFDIFVQLSSGGGRKQARNSGALNFIAGSQVVSISFDSSEIMEMGVDGPYSVSILELDSIDNGTLTTEDRRSVAGLTRSYTLSQFDVLSNGGISGNVTERSTGQPIAEVTVRVFDINGDPVAEATTDLSGAYTIDQTLHPGNYRALTENAHGFVDKIFNNIDCNGPCEMPNRTGTLILVKEGLQTRSIDFVLVVLQ